MDSPVEPGQILSVELPINETKPIWIKVIKLPFTVSQETVVNTLSKYGSVMKWGEDVWEGKCMPKGGNRIKNGTRSVQMTVEKELPYKLMFEENRGYIVYDEADSTKSKHYYLDKR